MLLIYGHLLSSIPDIFSILKIGTMKQNIYTFGLNASEL